VLPLDEQGKRFAALLSGRFEFAGFLGRGGFASVYKVRNLTLGRHEALKVLHDARAAEPGFAERFRHEARVAASLEHPSIVKVFEFGEVAGHFWYSMQLVDGPTVARELKIRGRLDAEKALKIAIPILDALDYAHVRGVVHRDVKPDNVILDEWDRAYLMDFGIAKLDDDVVKTAAGQMFGSPAYLSPEQARGLPLDGRSDVYALGITLFQMLSGEVPFASADRMATVTRRLTEDAPPVSSKVTDLPVGLEAIVARSLARDREARFATARDMKAELEAVLSELVPVRGAPARAASVGPPVAATPGAWVGQTSSGAFGTSVSPSFSTSGATGPSRAPGRRRALAIAAGVLAVAAVASFAVLRRAPREAQPGAAATAGAALPIEPTPAPAATAVPLATPEPAPAAAPTAVRAAAPRLDAAPPRPALHATRVPTPTPERRAKYPPDVVETADVTLTPELAAECGGRSVGVSVVVKEDGSLGATKVISPVSPACDEKALETIARYRFKPALAEDGKPVDGRFSFAVRF